MRHIKTRPLLGCIFITTACFAAYIPAIKGDFIWDDDRYVTENPLLTDSAGLWRIWFTADAPSQYFPLTYTSFWVERRLWGLNPMPYHVANVAIHVISALLIWLILKRLSVPVAFMAAAVFALHPVNVESVAWITERKNVLMLVFSLLSLLFWIELMLRPRSPKKAFLFYLLSLFCYALALFGKTTSCVLPIALILVIWLKRIPLKIKTFLLVIPYIAMGIAAGLLAMWWEHHHQGTGLVDIHLSVLEKLLIATRALWFYACKIVFPVNLAFSYPRWDINPANFSQYIWLFACLLTAAMLWFLRKKIDRGIIAAVIFFVAALFPMLGFFPLYTFVYTWVADHYQYMAAIALITLVTAAGYRLLSRFGKYAKIIMPLTGAVLLLICAVLTWRQCRIYANLETLWSDTLKKNPDSWLAHNNLGQILFEQGKTEELMYHLARAVEIAKLNPAVHPYSIASMRYNLALVYRSENRDQDAFNQLREAIDIFPDDPKTHIAIADLLESQGRFNDAVVEYKKAADTLVKYGEIQTAISYLRHALDIATTNGMDDLVEDTRLQLESYGKQLE